MKILTIQGTLPTLNEYMNTSRANKFFANTQKQEYTDMVAWQAKRIKIETPCYILFKWVVKSKRQDPDNISFGAKFILDGLVRAGALQNDNLNHILGIVHFFEIGEPHVEIHVVDRLFTLPS